VVAAPSPHGHRPRSINPARRCRLIDPPGFGVYVRACSAFFSIHTVHQADSDATTTTTCVCFPHSRIACMFDLTTVERGERAA
jgi:hypothetical protein